jgi:hypothetical protein
LFSVIFAAKWFDPGKSSYLQITGTNENTDNIGSCGVLRSPAEAAATILARLLDQDWRLQASRTVQQHCELEFNCPFSSHCAMSRCLICISMSFPVYEHIFSLRTLKTSF